MTELLEDEVIAELSEPSWWSLRWVQDIDSTNRGLIKKVELPEGTVLVAEHQTAGRGRLDRTWQATSAKSLLCSVLLRPAALRAEQRPLLTMVMANAIVSVGRDLGAELVSKWPNDVGIADQDGFHKLAGILAEASNDTVVIGFGLNVFSDDARPGTATSLAQNCELSASRPLVLARVLDNFLKGYRSLQVDGPEPLLEQFKERCDTLGRRVRVEQTLGSWTGVARSIDSLGSLIVDRDSTLEVISAGDVVHLRAIDSGQ